MRLKGRKEFFLTPMSHSSSNVTIATATSYKWDIPSSVMKYLKILKVPYSLPRFFLNAIEVMRILCTKKLKADYIQYTYYSK
jgi:hypothetical protein